MIRQLYRNISKTLNNKQIGNFNRHYGNKLHFELKSNAIRNKSDVLTYIDAYRKYGHHFALTDPLNLAKNKYEFPSASEFKLSEEINVNDSLANDETSHLKEIKLKGVADLTEKLKNLYAKNVGIEFDHIVDSQERDWLYKNYEKYFFKELTSSEKLNIHNLMISTEAFDHFLQKKFSTFKRYALEGNESMIISLRTMFARASELGVSDIVLGMPHRGRLNVLINLLDYPARDLFSKIMGKCDIPEEYYNRTDDVVSHIACSNRKTFKTGRGKEKEIGVTILNNPSHLEAANSVSMGKTRAKQDDYSSFDKVLNIQLHGDAAHTGQGVVYESLALSKVDKYTVKGTVHMVVNNQIGYTTVPNDGRCSKYCTELCKSFDIPIIHVNSDDPETVHKLSQFAIDYRNTFKKDFMIDLIGYRRYGHNEVDEPGFTQPLMYEKIRGKQTTSPKLYHQRLVEKNVAKDDEFKKIVDRVSGFLDKEYNAVSQMKRTMDMYKNDNTKGTKAFTEKWSDMVLTTQGKNEKTGINVEKSKEFAKISVELPNDFIVHPRLQKFFIQDRLANISKDSIDWPTAEAISALSILDEGFNIRLSGQDVERGTFSQRHWVLIDQKTENETNPIKNYAVKNNKGRIQVCNSPLSEYAVMGYEYGYSIENPKNLVIWEAQFGDFFNGAQIVIDTFLTSSENKWLRQNGLVLLLPHGFDGAGPEHSTFRMERFLQLANTDGINREFEYKKYDKARKSLKIKDKFFFENNLDVNFSLVVPTTPANIFHLLRRQMKRNYRKPLVVGSAKTLLRHPKATSSFADLAENTEFIPVLQYFTESVQNKKNIFACTGKVAYEIRALFEKKPELAEKTSLFVLEELLPFPEEILENLLEKYNKNVNFVWIQEEPMNSGAFSFVEPHLARIIKKLKFKKESIEYCGRRSIACPAIGFGEGHKEEVKELMEYISELANKE